MAFQLRIPILISCLFGTFLQAAGEELTDDYRDGLALVTTSVGEVVLTTPGGNEREVELHAVESLTGTTVRSGKGDYLFLSLSNGSALGIYGNSSVRFESYRQRPFPQERESQEYEPSRSKLVLQLEKGSLSFSAEQLSPLSSILIKLPMGRIEMYKASGHVLCDERGVRITVTSGILEYDYPGGDEQEFINAPNTVRIPTGSGKPGPIVASSAESNPAHELARQLVDATHHSRQRVIFKVESDEPSIPHPILVAKPEALLKPTPRPYKYRD